MNVNDCRRVLIAVNGSKDVLIRGLRLIGSEKSQIIVVKVNPPYDGDLNLTGVKNIEHVLDGGSEKTVSEIKEIARSKGVTVKVRIEVGEIDKKIVEVAEDEKCDLIIMGAGSQNSIRNFFLGNVVDQVTHLSPCPVLVISTDKISPVGRAIPCPATVKI